VNQVRRPELAGPPVAPWASNPTCPMNEYCHAMNHALIRYSAPTCRLAGRLVVIPCEGVFTGSFKSLVTETSFLNKARVPRELLEEHADDERSVDHGNRIPSR